LFDGSKDPVTPFGILLALLIIVQPKRCVNAYKNEDQLRRPATNA